MTIAGNIGQSGGGWGITKTGSGTLVLSGANTYSGGTTVLAGVLQVTSSDALPAGGSLTVGAGGRVVFGGGSSAASVSIASSPDLAGGAPPLSAMSTTGGQAAIARAVGGASTDHGPICNVGPLPKGPDVPPIGNLPPRQVENLSDQDAVLLSLHSQGPPRRGIWPTSRPAGRRSGN